MDFPNHYSLVNEHEKHFELHDARDGNTFNVSKKDLHPANQIKLMKMKKYDEGGDVEDTSDAAPDWQGSSGTMPSSQAPANMTPLALSALGQEPESSNQVEMPQSSPQQPQSAGQVGGMQPPGQTADVLKQFQSNQGLEEAGIKGQGAAQAKMGAENAKAQNDANEKIANFMAASDRPIKELSAQNDRLFQDIATNKVDPKNYYHNLSTGGKVANAIALIIGGIGSGLTHGPNVAMQVIDNAIARDIESQKINLGKKESLLSTNLARYKDMKMAQTATMSQMNSLVQGQIAANTAKYGGLAGQASTQAALGQLKNQNLQQMMGLKQQVFNQQIQQHLAQGKNIADDDPASYVRFAVDPAHQQKVFDEIDAAKDTRAAAPQVFQAFDNGAKKIHAVDFVPGMQNADQKSLHALLGPTFKDIEGTVRQAAMDNLFNNITPQFGDSKSTIEKKRDTLLQYMKSKSSAATAKGFGIDLKNFNSTSMDHVQPRQVKTVGGVRFERGPKGEAVRID